MASNDLIVVGLQGRDGAVDSACGVRGGWQKQLRSVIYLTLLLFCNCCRGQRGREQLKIDELVLSVYCQIGNCDGESTQLGESLNKG